MPCDDSDQPCGCSIGVDRRGFLKIAGVTALSAVASSAQSTRGTNASTIGLIPIDKHLDPAWLRSLTDRGQPTIYRGDDLKKIGMPIGGACAGQLYLGGDGKLWHWDIFNQHRATGDAHYAHPPDPDYPLDQGFALRVTADGKSKVHTLDQKGFPDVRFTGEYPIGFVTYADAGCPVTVLLEAFSPFIPLDTENSSLPATILHYTLKNTGNERLEVELVGWLQNAVCLNSEGDADATRRNELKSIPAGGRILLCSAEQSKAAKFARDPIVFADFEGTDYGAWKVEGTAFGKDPSRMAGHDQRLSGFEGKGLANSYPDSDEPQGKLTSPPFKIERPYISFLIGGGNHPGKTCINLVVDEKIAHTATGRNSDAMFWHNWDVRDLSGKIAHVEIIDAESGGWGHIEIDQIQFGDAPVQARRLRNEPDFGTMALAILGPDQEDLFALDLPGGDVFKTDALKQADARKSAVGARVDRPVSAKLAGALGRKLSLDPGQEATVTFVIAWHFPNRPHPADSNMTVGNYYAKRFPDAAAVVDHIASQFDNLAGGTRLWHKTWYDSTLPYWFLDRTFANTSILATSTCDRWRNGRFWCWEGVGCCIGTCTHVWHYAQAVARLFPELERSTREIQDLDTGFDESTGSIGMRGEFERLSATDGQTGAILRLYREHQMSADDQFLNRNWPRIKRAIEFVVRQDGNDDGILEGNQPNTLDTSFFGPNAMIGSLYLASVRAAEEMAREVGDAALAERLHRIFETGIKRYVDLLWNGEYFIQRPDPSHPEALKTAEGCFIDQVFGQSWAWQVGLGRILPQDKTISALKALWKYNFAPDVGPWREVYKPGRWYAMPGEAGLIMCTWPIGGYEKSRGKVNPGFAAYLNECMNGFEYQVAGHMIWEGLLEEGLAITRAIHDRYSASKRNPWNEVECGDHYARSMASYGVFLAACGYEHHGPSGYLAFAPRVSPDNFRAAFTTAEGWGAIEQKRDAGGQVNTIRLVHGRLRLRRLRFEMPPTLKVAQVNVNLHGTPVLAEQTVSGPHVQLRFPDDIALVAGQSLDVMIR